jgi:hypothetical protein
MTTNAAAWRGLTDAQRSGWKSLGLQITRSDSLGQSYDLSGFQAYCSVNNNKLDAGDAAVSDAPVITTPPDLLTATITLTGVAFSIAYTATPLGAGVRLFIRCSPQRSAGRTFNGDVRIISITAAAAASPANILAAYTAKFGVPVTGNRIFLSLQTYQAGFLGNPLAVSQVVAWNGAMVAASALRRRHSRRGADRSSKQRIDHRREQSRCTVQHRYQRADFHTGGVHIEPIRERRNECDN